MKAQAIMVRKVYYLKPTDTLLDAYILLKKERIRHFPVLAGNHLVGMISDREIYKWSSFDGTTMLVPDAVVEKIMVTDVMTCSLDSSISTVGQTMLDHKVDCLPVIEESELKGLITSSDLIQLLIDRDREATVRKLPLNYKLASASSGRHFAAS